MYVSVWSIVTLFCVQHPGDLVCKVSHLLCNSRSTDQRRQGHTPGCNLPVGLHCKQSPEREFYIQLAWFKLRLNTQSCASWYQYHGE